MGERGKFFFRLDNFLCCVKMNDGLLLTGLWSVINAALCVATISLCFFLFSECTTGCFILFFSHAVMLLLRACVYRGHLSLVGPFLALRVSS